MEDNKTFVDETDYKSLWEYSYKQADEAKALASERMDKIEDMERELTEAKLMIGDLEHEKALMGDTINRLRGEIDGLQYAIRYYMAGDPA